MSLLAAYVIATFTMPERIGIDPQSMLWLLPLAACIAVVYKATKVREVRPGNFFKESAVLFGSIIVFMAIAAFVLFALAWFVTQ